MLLCAWTLWPHMVQIPEASFVEFFPYRIDTASQFLNAEVSILWVQPPQTLELDKWAPRVNCDYFFLENYQVIMGDMMMFLSTFY